KCSCNPTTRSAPWTGARSSRSRRSQRATGWGGWAWRRLGSVRRPLWNTPRPPLRLNRSALLPGPPQELDLRFEGVKRHVPPPAGAIILVPAGTRGQVRWGGGFDWLHIYLEPGLFERVAAEAFDLDPARLTVPPLDGSELPHLRAAITAVGAELASGGPRGPLGARAPGQPPAGPPIPP